MELDDASLAPAEFQALIDTGRMLNLPRQTECSLPCVSMGLFCDSNTTPHFPPTGLAVRRWGAFFLAGRKFCMFPAKMMNDSHTVSWYTERVKAVLHSEAQPFRLAQRPPRSDGAYSFQPSLSAMLSWISLCVNSEATPMRREERAEDISVRGPANSHSALGLVDGCPALQLHRRST